MNTEGLLRLIENTELSSLASSLLSHARQTAIIVPDQTISTSELGRSRFSNSPDLPVNFSWPEHELGPYRFLGQFNLAELPANMPSVPSSGLLSLFYQYDPDGECFWGDTGYVIARYFKANERLVRTTQPSEVDLGESIGIRFEAGVDLPNYNVFNKKLKLINWPVDESQVEVYEHLYRSLHTYDDYLFGYPKNHSLGYDPTPGVNWQSLLTLGSNDDLSWDWHDGGSLVTFIESTKLATGDFSEIRSDAG